MICSLAAMPWLESASRPVVAATAVIPRSSGMSAATNDPSTTNRITIVSGIEIRPAFASPPMISASTALSVDAPSDSMDMPGWRFSALSMALTIVSM